MFSLILSHAIYQKKVLSYFFSKYLHLIKTYYLDPALNASNLLIFSFCDNNVAKYAVVLGELTCVCTTLPVNCKSVTSLSKVAGPKQNDMS